MKILRERGGYHTYITEETIEHVMTEKPFEGEIDEQISNETYQEQLLEIAAAEVQKSDFDVSVQSSSRAPPIMHVADTAEERRRMDHSMIAELEDRTYATKKA